MKINHIVIHELIKEQHKNIEEPNIRPAVLDSNHEIVIKLITEISNLYGKKFNTAHYGVFRKKGAGRGRFPTPLIGYSNIEGPTDRQFLDLTELGMDSLFEKAEGSSAASGGYILFSDYENSQGHFFLVAMIKQKKGITLSKDLMPEELTELDLSRLYQAARINFSKLKDYLVADKEAQQEINYLSFVSPRGGQTTAGYFVTAFGCAKGTASAQATKTLLKESVEFFKSKEELNPHKLEFREDLRKYLNEKVENAESVKLSEIEKIARGYMPAEEEDQADALADEFVTHLNAEDLAIPKEFPVNKAVLVRSSQIAHRSDNWELKFNRMLLGDTEDAKVFYDKENEKIAIKDYGGPQSLNSLTAEISSKSFLKK